jgi:gas vesicle protein
MSFFELLAKTRRRERRGSFGPVAIGTGLGMALGLIAGLLFAPRTGKETRAELGKTAKEAAVRVKGSVLEAREKLEETAGLIKDRFGNEEAKTEAAEAEVKKTAKH